MPRVAAPPPPTERMRQTLAEQEMRAYLSSLLLGILSRGTFGWASWIRRADVTDERRRTAVRNLAGVIYQDLIALLEEQPRCAECKELKGNRLHQERARAGFHAFRADVAPTTVGETDA